MPHSSCPGTHHFQSSLMKSLNSGELDRAERDRNSLPHLSEHMSRGLRTPRCRSRRCPLDVFAMPPTVIRSQRCGVWSLLEQCSCTLGGHLDECPRPDLQPRHIRWSKGHREPSPRTVLHHMSLKTIGSARQPLRNGAIGRIGTQCCEMLTAEGDEFRPNCTRRAFCQSFRL